MIFFVNLPVAAALAVAALKVIPADTEKPRWRGLDLRGAVLATGSLGAIVYAITQADERRLDVRADARASRARPRRPRRLRRSGAPDREAAPRIEPARATARVGGGLVLMLVDAGLDLRPLPALLALPPERPRHGPLDDRPAFIPLALAAGVGAHAAGHVVARHGVRMPLASAFAIAAVGMALLAHVGADGTYLRDVLPGMLVAGFGLGIAVVTVSIAILTGAREEESGMISGLNSTGHEIGGTIGIAVFSTIAAGSGGTRWCPGRLGDLARVRGSRAPG